MTFDKYGVSYHPNHIAVHHGVALAFEDASFPFDCMCLTTVSNFRKYTGYIDIANNTYAHFHYIVMTPFVTLRAMMIHHSQFVWYRKLSVFFSKYSYCSSFELYTFDKNRYNNKKEVDENKAK